MLRKISAWSVSIQSEFILCDSWIHLRCGVGVVIRRPSQIHCFKSNISLITQGQSPIIRDDSYRLFLGAFGLSVVRNGSLLIATEHILAVPVDERGVIDTGNLL